MKSYELPQLQPAIQKMNRIPYNTFEIYAGNPEGDEKRGGNCIFLVQKFLEIIAEIPGIRYNVIECLNNLHIALTIETSDFEKYFYDPSLLMMEPMHFMDLNELKKIQCMGNREWDLSFGEHSEGTRLIINKLQPQFGGRGLSSSQSEKSFLYSWPFEEQSERSEKDFVHASRSHLYIRVCEETRQEILYLSYRTHDTAMNIGQDRYVIKSNLLKKSLTASENSHEYMEKEEQIAEVLGMSSEEFADYLTDAIVNYRKALKKTDTLYNKQGK